MEENMKRSKLLVTAGVLSYIFAGIELIAGIMLGFNIMGMSDVMTQIMLQGGYQLGEVEIVLFGETLSMIAGGLISIYFGRFYFKVDKSLFKPRELGNTVITMAVVQILFSSFLPAIFGIIAGVKMRSNKLSGAKINSKATETAKNVGISEFKMTAMSEAVSRLNELRSRGAISDEEYYATLNKILEG